VSERLDYASGLLSDIGGPGWFLQEGVNAETGEPFIALVKDGKTALRLYGPDREERIVLAAERIWLGHRTAEHGAAGYWRG